MRRQVILILALLMLPSGATAQRDEFFNALLPFYRALAGDVVAGVDLGKAVAAKFIARAQSDGAD